MAKLSAGSLARIQELATFLAMMDSLESFMDRLSAGARSLALAFGAENDSESEKSVGDKVVVSAKARQALLELGLSPEEIDAIAEKSKSMVERFTKEKAGDDSWWNWFTVWRQDDSELERIIDPFAKVAR